MTDGDTLGTLFLLEVMLGLGGLVLALLAAPVLLYFHYSTAVVAIFLVLSVLAFAESFFTTFGAVLEKNLHFMPGSVIASIAMPISYIPAFWLALHDSGNLSLVAQAVTLTLVAMVAFALFASQRMRYIFQFRWRFRPALRAPASIFALEP